MPTVAPTRARKRKTKSRNTSAHTHQDRAIRARRQTSEFYKTVPKTLQANIDYRKWIREDTTDNPAAQQYYIQTCADDILFFVNIFGWTNDIMRAETNPEVPFITYPFQDELLLGLQDAIGCHDFCVKKSRDMGASWLCLAALLHRWMFYTMQSMLVVSRNENLVDKSQDPDSLFWKLDFFYDRLPAWMRPRRTRLKLHLHNDVNGSVIDGASTTGNVGRGGRRTAIMLDEFAAFEREDGFRALAATQQATKCRIFNSTPQGVGNAFFEVAHSDCASMKLYWPLWPAKAAGLYTAKDGRLEILDRNYRFSTDYRFILDGKIRSPYYDNECARPGASPMLIAQELDIDFLGSGGQYFDAGMLKQVEEFLLPPVHVGELMYDSATCEPTTWHPSEGGPFKLWTNVDIRHRISVRGGCVVGADISAGTGASNSCLCIASKETGEQVAEYAYARIRPSKFAELAVAVCRWFCDENGLGALLIWEANGIGQVFAGDVFDLGYRRLYRRPVEPGKAKGKNAVQPYGWATTVKNKKVLLCELGRAMAAGDFVPRSSALLRECAEYVYGKDGSPIHSKAGSVLDNSGAKDNHGDRVIGAAVCRQGLRSVSCSSSGSSDPPESRYGMSSHGGRLRAAQELKRREEEWDSPRSLRYVG